MPKFSENFKRGYKIKNDYIQDVKNVELLSKLGLTSDLDESLIYSTENYIKKLARNGKLSEKEKGDACAIAEAWLSAGVKANNPSTAHIGAILCEDLGYGGRASVVRRVRKAYDNGIKAGINLPAKNEKLITDFLEEHKGKDLSNKLLTSVFGVFTISGLLFGINSMTGAVTGISSNSFGILGVALFLGGIFGLFFSIKK